MKISVNLATRPFVELRPLLARLRLAMGLLVALAIGLAFGLNALTKRAHAAQTRMDALRDRTTAFQQERQRNEARMRQPQNRAVLERSQFLNELFARKSFSWTSIMMDLERVLPTGVQVISIEPVIGKDGSVSIRLKVAGDRDRAVQLVRNLEQSQRFLGPRLAGESAQAQDAGKPAGSANVPVDPLAVSRVSFDISSGYNPLPLVAKAAAEPKGAATKRAAKKAVKP